MTARRSGPTSTRYLGALTGHQYSLRGARYYFNLFSPFLYLTNFVDRPVYQRLLRSGDFATAEAIVELGPGTGWFAQRMLNEAQPVSRRLDLLEVSDTCLGLLRWRFRRCRDRVRIQRVVEGPPYLLEEAAYDRFVACFVLEMMDRETQERIVDEAARVLRCGGRFCILSVEQGSGLVSRATMSLARGLAWISPWLALGARFCPIDNLFNSRCWQFEESQTVVARGLASRLLIARRTDMPR